MFSFDNGMACTSFSADSYTSIIQFNFSIVKKYIFRYLILPEILQNICEKGNILNRAKDTESAHVKIVQCKYGYTGGNADEENRYVDKRWGLPGIKCSNAWCGKRIE